ncbi:hypothetical protein DRN34_02200 [Thermococci archaeon]|nr:MAG: hypothetical protein DRN34_02200 [Thermococci archaeon]
MITIDGNSGTVMQPGKTLVSVALLKEYESGTPVFVKCYRKSNTWTLPHTEIDYTNTNNPVNVMMDVIDELNLEAFDILSAEPIVDMIDEDKPARLIIYLAKAGNRIHAYQLYSTPEDERYRISRFMHQNQIFAMHKSVLLNLYITYLRSIA